MCMHLHFPSYWMHGDSGWMWFGMLLYAFYLGTWMPKPCHNGIIIFPRIMWDAHFVMPLLVLIGWWQLLSMDHVLYILLRSFLCHVLRHISWFLILCEQDLWTLMCCYCLNECESTDVYVYIFQKHWMQMKPLNLGLSGHFIEPVIWDYVCQHSWMHVLQWDKWRLERIEEGLYGFLGFDTCIACERKQVTSQVELHECHLGICCSRINVHKVSFLWC